MWTGIKFMGKLDIFPLMCAADKDWNTQLTLIKKNIKRVHNSHVQELNLILNIISQCDVKHILTSPIKTITAVLKILTYISTSFTAPHVGLAWILAIMSVSTFETAVILYIVYITSTVIPLYKATRSKNYPSVQ